MMTKLFIYRYVFIILILLLIGCLEPKQPKVRVKKPPDRFSFYQQGTFDSGKLDGNDYYIYVDTKTGQKYMCFMWVREWTMFPIIEPKEMIDADLKEMLQATEQKEAFSPK